MAVRVVVHGRVQGVFFRDSTRELAGRLGVRGWVRNDPGGTVTAHLEGDTAAVEQVIAWMRDGGPPRAQVTDVDRTDVDDQGHTSFAVRH